MKKFWSSLPEWAKVGVWIAFSAAITELGAFLLQKPELFQWYGLINFVLFTLKEVRKARK
jgi:hypothetical protein